MNPTLKILSTTIQQDGSSNSVVETLEFDTMKNRLKLNAILIGLLFTSLIPFMLGLAEMSVIADQEMKIELLSRLVLYLGYVSYLAGIYLTMRLAKESRILNAGIVVATDMVIVFGTYAVIMDEMNESPNVIQLILTWGTLIRIALVPFLYLLISNSGRWES